MIELKWRRRGFSSQMHFLCQTVKFTNCFRMRCECLYVCEHAMNEIIRRLTWWNEAQAISADWRWFFSLSFSAYEINDWWTHSTAAATPAFCCWIVANIKCNHISYGHEYVRYASNYFFFNFVWSVSRCIQLLLCNALASVLIIISIINDNWCLGFNQFSSVWTNIYCIL